MLHQYKAMKWKDEKGVNILQILMRACAMPRCQDILYYLLTNCPNHEFFFGSIRTE
jgi:hypothetical protein